MNNKINLYEAISQCKFPLKISLILDSSQDEEIYTLSVGYEGVFPAVAQLKEFPENLDNQILSLLEEFDIKSKNQILIKQKLQNGQNKSVKPIKTKPKAKTKEPKKTRLAKKLL